MTRGPNKVCDQVLRDCMDQKGVLMDITLSHTVIPQCFESTIIILVLNISTVSCLHDDHLVALTPIIMKCFE